jgi:hypothetical protein
MARAPNASDQAVAVQHGVDGALGRNAHVLVQATDQELANLARTPMWLFALEANDEALDLRRQLVGIAYWPPTAIAQRFEPTFLISIEDLVAGLARDAELPTDIGHRFAVEQFRHEPQALVHQRTLLPRHRHLPPRSGKCYPCVRYDVSPMSRAAQRACDAIAGPCHFVARSPIVAASPLCTSRNPDMRSA